MSTVRRRRKTGCLTCRQRRVKCDERKPTCERCEASNIHCAGYEQMRHIEVRHRPLPISPQSTQESPPSSRNDSSAVPRFEADGLPLVALPNNPTPAQRPHARARDVLAYHQYLFRTLPVLFPACNFHFWRDTLCQEAWETEYVFDTITALGSLHRAFLLLSRAENGERTRGGDGRVLALQSYTMAIQGLSRHLQTKMPSMDIVIAVVLLMAYFEHFNGNISAAIRHFHIAKYYYLVSGLEHDSPEALVCIKSSLRHLSFVCRIVLPLPLQLFDERSACRLDPDERRYTHAAGKERNGALIAEYMHQLLDIFSAEEYVADLLWSPFVKDVEMIPMDKIKMVQADIEDWKNRYKDPTLRSVTEQYPSGMSRRDIDGLLTTPHSRLAHTYQSALTGALYHFCMARLMWVMARINEKDEVYELSAYFHVNEIIQLSHFAGKSGDSSGRDQDHWVLGEALEVGFTALLYLSAQCCPSNSWRDAIIHRLRAIGREGLFNGTAFATSLTVLRNFDTGPATVTPYPGSSDRLGPPRSRAIPLMFTEKDGHNFILYILGPSPDRLDAVLGEYEVLCEAHWKVCEDGRQTEPTIRDFDDTFSPGRPTRPDSHWLLNQPIIGDWMDTFRSSGFDMDLAIHDHIKGTSVRLR
ncbi:hypothetical protein EDD36DRAFT_247110 [Exophiala viscosa]|uniref:Zn(2)-C6 fungal-type domain-containing protein n=1 Tax=Exophiala viscosa TaxID=2486360 RepID=A0AAN6DUD8_9EURO|nr:hypothetical protein EDD36DRAFT_247110 [Exophiala viscosa]